MCVCMCVYLIMYVCVFVHVCVCVIVCACVVNTSIIIYVCIGNGNKSLNSELNWIYKINIILLFILYIYIYNVFPFIILSYSNLVAFHLWLYPFLSWLIRIYFKYKKKMFWRWFYTKKKLLKKCRYIFRYQISCPTLFARSFIKNV